MAVPKTRDDLYIVLVTGSRKWFDKEKIYEDLAAVKARADGKEVLVVHGVAPGADLIADKCYVRINQEPELWFDPGCDDREMIVQKGIDILKKRFSGLQVTLPNGKPYNWE